MRLATSRVACCRVAVVLAAAWWVSSVVNPTAVASPTDEAYSIDPDSVRRYGPAYRYPQAGWIVLHIEGAPYDRGYQHGRLLAAEIEDFIQSLAAHCSPDAPENGWRDQRLIANALFLRGHDAEYLQEMKGIADGASDAGARFDDRRIDLLDIVTINADFELEMLPAGLDATSTGLEGQRFPEAPAAPLKSPAAEHCSAFAATAPATARGDIVFGHITMFDLIHVQHYNVWIDVRPEKGRRVLMQGYPGAIMSGLDYYLNDAGVLITETTIEQTQFHVGGAPLASRIRRAAQYAESIDQATEILLAANNGLYSNEWLLADIKTNEVAMFELGTGKSKLWRSTQHAYPGNTTGFYWGCNNAKDPAVVRETIPSHAGAPANLVFRPSDRDITWQRLYRQHAGKIDANFGFEAFRTPPLVGKPSCDAKFTASALASEMKTWALFGPPLGRTWEPTRGEVGRYGQQVRPLVSNDWTMISVAAPPPAGNAQPVDLDTLAEVDEEDLEDAKAHVAPVWRGTILPKSDADVWLAVAFSEYERIVRLEKALIKHAAGKPLSRRAKERIELAIWNAQAKSERAALRLGSDPELDQVRSDAASNEWYDIAAGKGVCLLHAWRTQLGGQVFDDAMDALGQQWAGQPVAAVDFVDALSDRCKRRLDLHARFVPFWVPTIWSIDSFEAEPERTLIIYGTRADRAAQLEAAQRLQRDIAERWSNFTVPIKADVDVTPDELQNHHLLLIGRPSTNEVTRTIGLQSLVDFREASFVVDGAVYAHPDSAVIVATNNPKNPRYSVVVHAGLSAAATWHCVRKVPEEGQPTPVLVFPARREPQHRLPRAIRLEE